MFEDHIYYHESMILAKSRIQLSDDKHTLEGFMLCVNKVQRYTDIPFLFALRGACPKCANHYGVTGRYANAF